jgi:hypothetical protein
MAGMQWKSLDGWRKLMNIFRRFKGREKPQQDNVESSEDIPGIRSVVSRDMELLTLDLDSFSPEAQRGLQYEIAKINKLPLFDGQIEHGFSKRGVASTDKCPRCGAATQQCSASFVYATDIAPRAMLAPAGYFCTSCPTVTIDEEIISAGMKQGFRFRCVVGIDHGKKRLDLFTTWNGKKPIYVLDENQQIMDMATEDELRVQPPPAFRPKNGGKEKRRRKMEKKARKRNRRSNKI